MKNANITEKENVKCTGCIVITLNENIISVYHGFKGTLLFRWKVKLGDWGKLWKAIRGIPSKKRVLYDIWKDKKYWNEVRDKIRRIAIKGL